MGYGTYSTSAYAKSTGAKIASGSTFSYDRTARSTGVYKAHESVDPKKLNADKKNLREARDNVDNPNTVPVVVGFDSTGSMRNTPRVVQQKLTTLFGLLVRQGYLESPAVSVATYGDAYCDRVPLQISQFEADNRVDDALDNLILEGGGGGNGGETATLLWYYLNKHVVTDAWEKRNKKGYLFLIADEIALDLKPSHVVDYIGDEPPADTTKLTVANIAKELQEKWDVYILLMDNDSAHWQGSYEFYKKLFGDKHVVVLENDETVSETIGAMIGRLENDDLDDDELINDLVAEGATKAVAEKTARSLAKISGAPKGAVAKANVDVAPAEADVDFL